MTGRAQNPNIFISSILERSPCSHAGNLVRKFYDSFFAAGLARVRDMWIFRKESLSNTAFNLFGVPFLLRFSVLFSFNRMLFSPLRRTLIACNSSLSRYSSGAFIRAIIEAVASIIEKRCVAILAYSFTLDSVFLRVIPHCAAKLGTESRSAAKWNIYLTTLLTGSRLFGCIFSLPFQFPGNGIAFFCAPTNTLLATRRARFLVGSVCFKRLFTTYADSLICFSHRSIIPHLYLGY